jgi:DNA-binding beta-propeller fold protein YncE
MFFQRILLTAAASLIAQALVAQPAGRPVIAPSLSHVDPGASKQFKIDVDGRPAEGVTWSVNDAVGGDAKFGRISRNGLYTAPGKIPQPREVHIHGVVSKPRTFHVWATVIVGQEPLKYRLVTRFGERGTGPGKVKDPHGFAFDRDRNLIITDALDNRVYRFSKQGKYLGELGFGAGSDSGQFKQPRDVKVDAAGNIIIADADNHRIQVFDPKGKFVRMYGKKGSDPGDMLRVHALEFGTDGKLYAVDVDNSRVMVFDPMGKLLFQWGKAGKGPGEFQDPHALASDANGDIFVSNYWGSCQKFTGDGKYLFEFAIPEKDAFTHAHAINGDRWGNVYMMARDKDNRNAIVKYNNNGTLITTWPALRPVKEWGVKAGIVDNDGTIYVGVESHDIVGIEVYAEQ